MLRSRVMVSFAGHCRSLASFPWTNETALPSFQRVCSQPQIQQDNQLLTDCSTLVDQILGYPCISRLLTQYACTGVVHVILLNTTNCVTRALQSTYSAHTLCNPIDLLSVHGYKFVSFRKQWKCCLVVLGIPVTKSTLCTQTQPGLVRFVVISISILHYDLVPQGFEFQSADPDSSHSYCSQRNRCHEQNIRRSLPVIHLATQLCA